MAAQTEVLQAIRERYRDATRKGRGRILDEFIAITGHHRKHAIRLLSQEPQPRAAKRGRPPTYGPEVRAAMFVLWNLSDRLCSKRLKEMIPLLLPAAIRHGVVRDDEVLAERLRTISAATIDRLIAEDRVSASTGRRRRSGMSSAIRREVPIRTFNDWGTPELGFVEADFVAHGGTNVAGSFIQTLVLTDIASGWTECVPVLTRSAALIIDALRVAIELFPFPLRGIDFDNDGSFMNDLVVPWCRERGLEVTRSRAYKKNDQAWVEQKNGAIVRRLVGYGRLEGVEALQVLCRLYAAARLQTNVCHPSFKLISKTRIGARVKKNWDRPRTPAARILARPEISAEIRRRVAATGSGADPIQVLQLIRQAQKDLGDRIDHRGHLPERTDIKAMPPLPAQPTTHSIAAAKSVPQIHRRPYRRTKPVPVKPSRLDSHAAQVKTWLEVEPGLTARAVHARLFAELGAIVSCRTAERLVRRLRAEMISAEIALISKQLGLAA